MRRKVYETDDEWRTVVIMNLVHLRRTLYELGFLVAFVAAGFALEKFWDIAAVIASVSALLAMMTAYSSSKRDYEKLSRIHFGSEYDDDE